MGIVYINIYDGGGGGGGSGRGLMGRRIFSVQISLLWFILGSICGSVQVKGKEESD